MITKSTFSATLLVVSFGCGSPATSDEGPGPLPSASPSAPSPAPASPSDAGITNDPRQAQPTVPLPPGEQFRCPLESFAPFGHRAAWKPIAGATRHRVYETNDGRRELTFESERPSVFFSTSGWSPTGVEIVWVDEHDVETPIWPEFTSGITANAFDQLVAVGHDEVGPVLQIRDCVTSAAEDYAPELAVRSLRIPGATELRDVAVHRERRELFLRGPDRVYVLQHFTTAGSSIDASGAPRLDVVEARMQAPLGPGSALAVLGDSLFVADGSSLVRFQLDTNGWHETGRSASFGNAIERIEAVSTELHVILAATAPLRLVRATWGTEELHVVGSSSLPLPEGPLLTAVNVDGPDMPRLYFASPGGTDIVQSDGLVVLSLPFPVVGLSAGMGRLYARAADGSVSSWRTDETDGRSFRMAPGTIHRELMLPLHSFIIE